MTEHSIVAAVYDRDTYQAKHGNALSPPAISKLWEDDMVAFLAGSQDVLGGAGGEGKSVEDEATAASTVTSSLMLSRVVWAQLTVRHHTYTIYTPTTLLNTPHTPYIRPIYTNMVHYEFHRRTRAPGDAP